MKEYEIRPEAVLNKYLELSAKDAENCFADTSRLEIACVACSGTESNHQFEKSGFSYVQCVDCGTLFQSPRPPIAAFEEFCRESESSRYWAEVFFPTVAEIRREKIIRPRVECLAGICAERGIQVKDVIDVGAGYGIFLEEWRRSFPQARFLAVEPSSTLAQECRSKGFEVLEDIVENVAGYDNTADLVTCFDVLEHVYDPLQFIRALKSLVRPGGYIFLSTLGIDGFDLQVLWEKSSPISPPHHINFLSVQGFEQIFHRAGLVDIIITTPGQLDMDIVRNAVKRDSSVLHGQSFLRNLLADDHKAAAFQRFLVEQRMSSHTWIMGQKQNDLEMDS